MSILTNLKTLHLRVTKNESIHLNFCTVLQKLEDLTVCCAVIQIDNYDFISKSPNLKRISLYGLFDKEGVQDLSKKYGNIDFSQLGIGEKYLNIEGIKEQKLSAR